MKIKGKYILLFLIAAMGFSSCGKDRSDEYYEMKKKQEEQAKKEEANRNKTAKDWIYDTLNENYLWYQDMKPKSSFDFKTETTDFKQLEDFFNSCLSQKDGKHNKDTKEDYYYSRLENTSIFTRSIQGIENSYGMEFMVIKNKTNYFLQVLYVAHNSPAEKAGIERGNLITQVDGHDFQNKHDFESLLSGRERRVKVLEYDYEHNKPTGEKIVTLGASTAIEDNPVYFSKVLQKGNKKIGYIVYNHFTAGPTEKSNAYDNELIEKFAKLKAENVRELILDLRYNNGGLVTSADKLASLIVEQGSLSNKNIFCTLTYNDKAKESKYDMYFDTDKNIVNANLGLSRVFILCTGSTASASELVINGLRPFMPVTLIGAQTEGKNVASQPFDNEKYHLKMWPIVARLSNAKGESNYQNGFTPDVQLNNEQLFKAFPFGDERDPFIEAALNRIGNGGANTRAAAPAGISHKAVYSSLDRKATPGAVISR